MNYDVTALGELLIDFSACGYSDQGNPLFEANPGGAPCNVLAMLSKLGKTTAFIGKVGDDMFGRQLKSTIEQVGIESAGLVADSRVNTTLAFVQNAADGEREFSFFRKPGADTALTADELNLSLIKQARIFHFGSLSLTNEPARAATKHAVQLARQAGVIVSFDPNLRVRLWDNLQQAREQILWGCAQCQIIKVAYEELELLTDCADAPTGAAKLQQMFPQLRMILVTMGKDGSGCYCDGRYLQVPTFLTVKTIDTTGAGDTFMGCCLGSVLDSGLQGLSQQQLEAMLLRANAAASLVTTKKGAIRSMPEPEQVLALMQQE